MTPDQIAALSLAANAAIQTASVALANAIATVQQARALGVPVDQAKLAHLDAQAELLKSLPDLALRKDS
jgi:hypothetical protein